MKNSTFFLIIILLYSLCSYSQNQESKINQSCDSLLNIINTTKNDSLIAATYIHLGNTLKNSEPEKALQYAKKGLLTAKKHSLTSILEKGNNLIGIIHYTNGNYIDALKFFEQALFFAQESDEKQGIANSFLNIGNIHETKGNYPLALDNYQKALRLFEELSKSTDKTLAKTGIYGVARSCNACGIIHDILENQKMALDYYKKALKIFEEMNDKKGMSISYMNMGIIYWRQKNLNLALEFYNKSMTIDKETNDLFGLSNDYINIGAVYSKMKKYNQAIDYYKQAMKISEKLNDKYGIALASGNISESLINLKNYQSALDFEQKSLQIAIEIGELSQQKGNYLRLSEIFDYLNNKGEALRYHKLFTQIKDSLFNSEKHKQLSQIEALYQNEKKENEIELLSKDQELKNTKIQQQNAIIIGFVFGFLIVLVFSVLLIRLYRLKRRANIKLVKFNAEILEKNEEIQQQNEEIQAQAEQLETTNKELEKLSIVASETDNSVIIANENGEIEWVNKGFSRIFGYTKDEFIFEHGSDFKKASNNPEIEDVIQKCISKQQSVNYTTLNTTKYGVKIWTQTTLNPILKNGKLFKLVAIDSDITKLMDAENEIRIQKSELEFKNQEILNSISYAKLIQEAILPADKEFEALFSEYFVFYKPLDIVSGDFYWLHRHNNLIFIATADCTGHGVSGAFMTMIGNSLLNEIIIQNGITEPNLILDKLCTLVIKTLNKDDEQIDFGKIKNGMDITLCVWNTENNELRFAGANNPIYIIRNNELSILKGDKQPIGFHKKSSAFSIQTFQLQKGDSLYFFTDGFSDQLGGPDELRYKSYRFQKALLEFSHLKMAEQKEKLTTIFNNWKGSYFQTDDIIVMGLKM